jgi:hypothetical protein
MLKEGIVKNIIIIDDKPEALKFVAGLFEKYVESEVNTVRFLYYHKKGGGKQASSSEDSPGISVNGVKELLSDDFISLIAQKINSDPNCWALIDIRLDLATYSKHKKYSEWESVRFAEKLVDRGTVKISRLFFYSSIVDLPPVLTQFRKDTDNKNWNVPLS